MSVKQRLKDFVKYKNLSERKFCISVGLSPTYINGIRNSIQPDKVHTISVHYPDLNTGWLLTGEGEMLKNNDEGVVLIKKLLREPPKDYGGDFLAKSMDSEAKLVDTLLQYINRLQEDVAELENINEKLLEENKRLKESK